jgi:hypothetical protein
MQKNKRNKFSKQLTKCPFNGIKFPLSQLYGRDVMAEVVKYLIAM